MTEQLDAVHQIDVHRAKIDILDEQIVSLLNRRAEESLAIRALKPQAKQGLYDPRREEDIFEKVESWNAGPMYNDNVRDIYATILKVMKELRA